MKPDIRSAINALRPAAECSIRGNSYAGIEWLDKSQTKPTEEEVNAKLTELNNEFPMKLLREERTKRLAQSDWMANSDVTILLSLSSRNSLIGSAFFNSVIFALTSSSVGFV